MNVIREIAFIRWGYPYMIFFTAGIHINTGLFMTLDARVGNLLPFFGLKELSSLGLTTFGLGVALMVVGALACVALILEPRLKLRIALLLLLPQYGLMVAAFLSDAWLLINGATSSSGNPVAFTILEPLVFIIMFAALLHTLSIIERFVVAPRRDGND